MASRAITRVCPPMSLQVWNWKEALCLNGRKNFPLPELWLNRKRPGRSSLVPRVFHHPSVGKMKDPGNEIGVSNGLLSSPHTTFEPLPASTALPSFPFVYLELPADQNISPSDYSTVPKVHLHENVFQALV